MHSGTGGCGAVAAAAGDGAERAAGGQQRPGGALPPLPPPRCGRPRPQAAAAARQWRRAHGPRLNHLPRRTIDSGRVRSVSCIWAPETCLRKGFLWLINLPALRICELHLGIGIVPGGFELCGCAKHAVLAVCGWPQHWAVRYSGIQGRKGCPGCIKLLRGLSV